MKLSIVIPIYNEERTIAELIEKIQSVQLPKDLSKEIVIVNDGSTDKTAAVIEKYLWDPSIQLFHQENKGKAAAVMSGIEKASGDIILIQDADLEYDPHHYSSLVKPIMDGENPVVYGSRFLGNIKGMRFWIRVANKMTNLTLNAIYRTKMTDVNTCFKVFRKDVLDGIEITSSHFGFDTELTVKIIQKGITIHEIPIDYVARTKEEGKKITFRTSFKSYLCIIYYSFKRD